MSARKGEAGSKSTPLPPEEYEGLIERVRETANAVIPRNATVLVVSRGDDELLQIGPRRGLHFPQDEFGSYQGYHPEDSDAAIAVLEDMRARGGEYLLVPETAFWWLDYYEGLHAHLMASYPSVFSGDDCMIFELAGVQAPMGDADSTQVSTATTSRRLAEPLDELLRALLPADATIAVVTAGDLHLPSFPDCTVVPPPHDADGVATLPAQASAGGARFVVIPATAENAVEAHGGSPNGLDGWRLVTRQRHLAAVYERSSELPSDSRLWDRIRNVFRGG